MELKSIGRYDIKSLIGQGGMSAVYLGYDPRSMREVAIKILPPYYLHAPKFRERFEREALMIALLEHPAIVPVYDMGEEDGTPYIVMRYMSGGSLSEKLKKGPIPLRECVDMYLRLAPALDTAHSRGVTHRDVKPDNLLFDKYDNVFLSDFGLARLRETIGFSNISDGSIMGTPAYMSPEQIQGDREIDGRSDIYSMGVVLYQMLCASVPFTGTTAASVMMMHLINPVPQIFDQNRTLPLAIQSVLEKAMAKDPSDRYQSAGDFAKALQAVITGVHKKLTLQPPLSAPATQPVRRSTLVIPAEKTPPLVAPISPGAEKQPSSPLPVASRPGISLPWSRKSQPKPAPLLIQSSTALKPSTSQPDPLQQRKPLIPAWTWITAAALVLVLAVSLVQWLRGGFPFDLLPGTPAYSRAHQAPLSTLEGASHPPALGEADQLAFLNAADIWVSNLDGSNLTRLTTDGQAKSNLHWSPDGQSILFTAGNCIQWVGLQTKQSRTLSCFNGLDSIHAFDISANGQLVAIGLGESDIYLFPYPQLFRLRLSSFPADLSSLAQCSYYAPYHLGNTLKAIKWSLAESRLAVLISKTEAGAARDEVSILDFSQCNASPQLVKQIPPTYFLFTLRGYYDHPEISGLAWSSGNQLLLNGFLNKDGFGDLQLYNLDQNQSRALAPNGNCCYRDIHWSPDGTYLFYSFQPEAGGEISLYYVPLSQLDSPGNEMSSLALPAGFFSGDIASLQPTLRITH